MSKNEQAKSESDAVRFASDESELSGRLKSIIGDEPKLSFAKRADVAESVLRKYLAGAMPSTDRLVRLAATGGVTIEWLATGKGPRRPGAAGAHPVVLDDLERLQRTVEAVEKGLRAIGRQLPPGKYAELVVAAYQLMAAPSASSAQIVQFIKAAR
jgi:hypothetical protein